MSNGSREAREGREAAMRDLCNRMLALIGDWSDQGGPERNTPMALQSLMVVIGWLSVSKAVEGKGDEAMDAVVRLFEHTMRETRNLAKITNFAQPPTPSGDHDGPTGTPW